MRTSFLIIPLEGNFRTSFAFTAAKLNSPDGFDCEEGDLESFLSCIALHNGVWHMKDGRYGIAVQVVDQTKGRAYPDMLLLVDDLFVPRALRYVPLSYQLPRSDDGLPMPKGAAGLLAAASFVLSYGNSVYDEKREEWEKERYTGEEIVRALKFYLMGEDAPWKRHIHVRSDEFIDEDEACQPDQVLLAEQWTFLDNSVAYLTPTGLKSEDEFQHRLVGELKIPQPDLDFRDHYLYSTSIN